jgi:hypothetical protein
MKYFAILLLTVFMSSAQAAPVQYGFSYTFADGEVLSGSIIGDAVTVLQAIDDPFCVSNCWTDEQQEVSAPERWTLLAVPIPPSSVLFPSALLLLGWTRRSS